MKKLILFLALFSIGAMNAQAQCNNSKAQPKAKTVKYTAAHQTEPDVVDIAISSKAHTTLVAAVKAANLVSTLKGDGPFTIFAPTNAAFDKLPAGTVNTLLRPENKSTLANILTYHVLAGKFTAADVVKAIQLGGGTANMKSVNGGMLTAMMMDGKVVLKDENGNHSTITATDLEGSNGVIHVLDTVVLPK